ncbi:hypothetical protein BKA93DRAFT_727298, partial [Sparassis latifolia]
LGSFPRAMFSERELEAMRWFGTKNGMHNLPSVKEVKRGHESVVEIAGGNTQTHESAMKNMYAMADFQTVIKHEFANPMVQHHIHTMPEDSGDCLGECRQAARWRLEADANIACPMAWGKDGKHYFIEEVAMANMDSYGTVSPVMIKRWCEKGGELWASINSLLLWADGSKFVVDCRQGANKELRLDAFFLSAKELMLPEIQCQYGLPSPQSIKGILSSDDPRTPLESWDHPTLNPWRERAQGKRVLSLPIWLYCDDTSGNRSKKWNKHNSLLFTLAGLPCSLVHLMYNIHYLATSNIAAPLEMAEELASVLRMALRSGIVNMIKYDETVLVVPWILAFLGDNPMSSEFASHIGMKGKCFCRTCMVRGADDQNREKRLAGERSRIDDFMKSGEPCSKENTLANLKQQLRRVLGGAPSAVDDMATQSGTKDKYFHMFMAQLQDAVNTVCVRQKGAPPPQGMTKSEELRQTLAAVHAELPDNLFNLVLFIPDFDPNQDSPFEALHVVLLGAVKYFWRDAVSRQTSDGKQTLKIQLDSANVSELGISPLRGTTFIQYAGSLVERDFRAILQVAPSVLHGLIPPKAYEAWLALCRLAPLIFQPVLENLSHTGLRARIIVYMKVGSLVEGFESYNFIIRLRSVHSNRHAPSHDIAKVFSFLHAVRHLTSGGFVYN